MVFSSVHRNPQNITAYASEEQRERRQLRFILKGMSFEHPWMAYTPGHPEVGDKSIPRPIVQVYDK